MIAGTSDSFRLTGAAVYLRRQRVRLRYALLDSTRVSLLDGDHGGCGPTRKTGLNAAGPAMRTSQHRTILYVADGNLNDQFTAIGDRTSGQQYSLLPEISSS